KKTDKLIDWNIRNHHSKEDVFESKIGDGYEKTNLWKINPSRYRKHPATFPYELAERVIKYYSFKNDVVLDPFAGSGTTAKAAIDLGRKFVMCEISEQYIDLIIEETMLGGDLEIIK
ncbi:TPA: DNA methyltransferase, partial [Salmonella enterica]|nr:site-specific DNA-methyltransferase [Salmonella enterica subsp. enterica serovar Senftenberg]HDN7660255.1 site-specific DNA-methyltransferase [Salmonella enterica subsp. enterica serovar Corvallis]